MTEQIEFQNDSDELIAVSVCRSAHTEKLYVHLLDESVERIHDEKTTRVEPEEYVNVEINEDVL